MVLLRPLMEPSVFFLFLAAVTVSALYGGLGPGLAATALSGLACNYFFLRPHEALFAGPEGALRLGIFLATGALVSWLAEGRKRAEERLRELFWLPSPLRTPRRLLPLPSNLRPSSGPWSARIPMLPPTTPVSQSRYPPLALSPLSAKFLPCDGSIRYYCNDTASRYAPPAYFGPTIGECPSRCALGHLKKVSRAARYGMKARTWCPATPLFSPYHPKGHQASPPNR
jgi:hypothetical protein